MSIRSDFQPTVDEFIENLETFASGSYLKDGEAEFWDAPFDLAVIPDVRAVLEDFLSSLDTALDSDERDALIVCACRNCVEELESINATHEGAVIEPEEREEITDLMLKASKAAELSDDCFDQLPEF